jgi:hypothetical protein
MFENSSAGRKIKTHVPSGNLKGISLLTIGAGLFLRKLMTVLLSEAFIVYSESNLPLISHFLCNIVICRLFGLGREMGTEGTEGMLSGEVCLMQTIDEEHEADQ